MWSLLIVKQSKKAYEYILNIVSFIIILTYYLRV